MRRSQTGEPSELDLMAIACLLPSLLYGFVLFIYPFLYGIYLSVHPLKVDGFSLANYVAFFTDQYQYKTVGITFRLAVPNTVVVVAVSLLLAYNMRRGRRCAGSCPGSSCRCPRPPRPGPVRGPRPGSGRSSETP